MRWTKPRKPGVPKSWVHEKLLFHDLLDDNDNLLGWVVEDKRTHNSFAPRLNDSLAAFPTQSTLKEAKALLVAHFIANKLEDT